MAVQAALLLLLALGFIALGVEMSQLLLEQRKQQSVADSAAVAAAAVLGRSDPQDEARAVAAELGYQHGVDQVSVTLSNPPTAGAHAGDDDYVEVTVQRAVTPALVQLYQSGAFTVRARAVATRGQPASNCLTVLDPTSGKALEMDNSATLRLSGCGLTVNSTSNSAIDMKNSARVEGDVTVAGDVAYANSAKITGTVTTDAEPAVDPLAEVDPGSRPANSLSAPSQPTAPLEPGWYPGGWEFTNDANVQLKPGTYWLGNQFTVKNNAKLNGTAGVTIILDGDFGISFDNSAEINLTARTTGATSGIAIHSLSDNSSSITHQFKNNATLNIVGALYFPSQRVEIDNSVSTTSGSCMQLIARMIEMKNNADITLKSSCSGAGQPGSGSGGAPSLVE